ncbi:MAG: ubiquinone biosynthesis accessory factor UbiJ [Gammaproteobacteria bacterium]
MKQWIIESLQKALNYYLALDPESRQRMHALQGKVITIDLLGLGVSFQLVFDNDQVKLSTSDFVSSATQIKGTPLSLLRMALSQGDRKQFFSDDVSIDGDLDLGQEVIDLFDQLEIDWEEYLSHLTGDVSAHQIGRFARKIKQISERTRSVLLQNVNEYVHEEIDLVPANEAIKDFFSDVDDLRMDVDRMAARIEQLKRSAQ